MTDRSINFLESKNIIINGDRQFRETQKRNHARMIIKNATEENEPDMTYDADTFPCPNCKVYACRADWEECPNCNSPLVVSSPLREQAVVLSNPEELTQDYLDQLKECPECGYHCQPDWSKCPECKHKFKKDLVTTSPIQEKETEELDAIPEDLARILGDEKFKPFIDTFLPNTYCRSCGKRQAKEHEFSTCKTCQDQHLDPREIIFCPNCGKEVVNIKRGRILKREISAKFCLNCLQPFIPSSRKYQKYDVDKLFHISSGLDRGIKIFMVAVLHIPILLIFLLDSLTYFNITFEWSFNYTLAYIISSLIIIVLLQINYSKLKSERIAKDEHYRLKIATIMHARERDKRMVKRKYKFKIKEINELISKCVRAKRRVRYYKYIFYGCLMIALVN